MKRRYYTLAIYLAGRFTPQFGDYDKNVVVAEGRDSWAGFRKRIVRSAGTQKAINEAMDRLNNETLS